MTITSPLKAIRQNCIECCGGSKHEVSREEVRQRQFEEENRALEDAEMERHFREHPHG